MRYAAILFAFALAVPGKAEIIDGIAVTVDNRVITESGIRREIRVTAFLNGDKPDLSPESKRQTAERLVEQAIIRNEMDITRYPGSEDAEMREALEQVRKERFHGDESAYQAALKQYHITQDELVRHLARQASTLKFLDLRFRPEVQLSETEVRDYYDKVYLPAWRKDNPGEEASFDELRPEAEEGLAAERVDKLVDKWMREARARMQIRYREEAFK